MLVTSRAAEEVTVPSPSPDGAQKEALKGVLDKLNAKQDINK
jgi:hypothetical protein